MIKNLTLGLLALLAVAMPALAQEGSAQPQDPQAYTAQTADPDIAEAELKRRINPLLKEQVEVEAEAWLALLVAKNQEIAANPEQSTQLSLQRSGLVSRMTLVTDAYTARGGDASKYVKYVEASTGADLADVAGMFDLAVEWVKSPEGGIKLAINFGLFLITLIAFMIISRIAAGATNKALNRMKKTSDLLRDFFINVVRKLVFFIGLIIALKFLGLDVTPFVAALGAAGFIIGFALQGTLSNFAAGLMILMYRPYDIGHLVSAAGMTGTVKAMTLVSTTLRLGDNQHVVIPNGKIWGDVITNITGQTTRRVDMTFGCGYGDDLKKVQAVLEEIVANHPKVLKDPEPVIKLHELADSSVNFIVRPWANSGDYWEIYWDVTRKVKERFDEEGLNIPFPQRDVHLHQANG
jgi:small conductance mechanosensitive channel